ncbi:hypothetical protein TNCV_913081 [Trichonephila clavipes]|nr:hypothetical protein TNCV_913081 [Trichonephila clavipes]
MPFTRQLDVLHPVMLFERDLRLLADLLFSRPPDAPLAPEEEAEDPIRRKSNWTRLPQSVVMESETLQKIFCKTADQLRSNTRAIGDGTRTFQPRSVEETTQSWHSSLRTSTPYHLKALTLTSISPLYREPSGTRSFESTIRKRWP